MSDSTVRGDITQKAKSNQSLTSIDMSNGRNPIGNPNIATVESINAHLHQGVSTQLTMLSSMTWAQLQDLSVMVSTVTLMFLMMNDG